ncbi:hypothetical protein ILYODFUR_028439 [Ilyodon furcidens]|uniref:Secreted protein n=1 Tax=Ilyodon furcidens TaxID=33524 RepID=A0ABV0SPZ0_9TELE
MCLFHCLFSLLHNCQAGYCDDLHVVILSYQNPITPSSHLKHNYVMGDVSPCGGGLWAGTTLTVRELNTVSFQSRNDGVQREWTRAPSKSPLSPSNRATTENGVDQNSGVGGVSDR